MNFKLCWELFINGFDSLEHVGSWDVEKYGEMEAYCENILICLLVKSVFADKSIQQDEIDAINDLFGLELTLSTVTQIYEIMESENEDVIDNLSKSLEPIKQANINVYERFKDTITEACQTIIDSDGIVSDVEKNKVKEILMNM